MTKKEIIKAAYGSFYSLIHVIKKPLDFESIPADRLKIAVEGRYQAFIVASSQLNKIKDIQDSIGEFNEKKFRKNLNELLDSTKYILSYLVEALMSEIDLDEDEGVEDTLMKNVVMMKKIALDFILEINATKEGIELTLNQESMTNVKKDFATMRVKRKING